MGAALKEKHEALTPVVKGTGGSLMLWVVHCSHWIIHLYPAVKQSCAVFQVDSDPSKRHEGVTEWFDEYEDDGSHALSILQSPDFNQSPPRSKSHYSVVI